MLTDVCSRTQGLRGCVDVNDDGRFAARVALTHCCRCAQSAAVVADICAHATPSPPPVAGVVFVAPLPFLGAAMTYGVAPPLVDVVQTLGAARDAAVLGRAKTAFVDALVASPARRIPDATKAAWLGRSVAQEPEATNGVFCRAQDATRLLDAGRRGLPLMVLVGAEDALVDSAAVVRELRRHFRNSEAHVVAGGSHALFVDRRDEFVKHLLMFVGRLAVSGPFLPLTFLSLLSKVPSSSSRTF